MPRKPKYKLKPLNLNIKPVGDRIAEIRKSKNLTQEELAKEIGITRSNLSKYENNAIHLNDEMMIRFALALEVSLDYLVGLESVTEKDKKHKK